MGQDGEAPAQAVVGAQTCHLGPSLVSERGVSGQGPASPAPPAPPCPHLKKVLDEIRVAHFSGVLYRMDYNLLHIFL